MVKHGQTWSKMVKNGQQWKTVFLIMLLLLLHHVFTPPITLVKNGQYGLKLSNMVKHDKKDLCRVIKIFRFWARLISTFGEKQISQLYLFIKQMIANDTFDKNKFPIIPLNKYKMIPVKGSRRLHFFRPVLSCNLLQLPVVWNPLYLYL